jgi:hypothetical protein
VTALRLIARSLAHYRRTHAAVVLGVAVAVSVLAGALLVGESVRASLRELFLRRIGNVDHAITAARFFGEILAERLAAGRPAAAGRAPAGPQTAFGAVTPLVILEGAVTHEASGRRGSGVLVYGVDERFWAFHGRGVPAGLSASAALLSEALASELQAEAGSALLVRIERPQDVPAASLFGRKDDLGRTLRLTAGAVLGPGELGEFSLRPRQQAVRAVFVPLKTLQRSLEREGQVNALLIAAGATAAPVAERTARIASRLREVMELRDVGLTIRPLLERGALSVESESALLDDDLAEAVRAAASGLGMRAVPVLTYLASAIRFGERSIPYSLVTALEAEEFVVLLQRHFEPPILLNEWAADDLGVVPGDIVSLDYPVWEEQGSLQTRSAEFRVVGTLPLTRGSAAADPDLTPRYPGISASRRLSEWDPPFPIDLSRIRARDEEYWERHRTTPKAFVALARGQELWGHRLGRLTSIRLYPREGLDLGSSWNAYQSELRASLDPLRLGFALEPVRAAGLEASRGATDFGEYFLYFSSFLVGSALLLTGLFFRLGVEQRLREIGLLSSLGFARSRVRLLLLGEGLVLAALGALLGAAGSAAYAALLIVALRTFWLEAVGTRQLGLHVSWSPLLTGALAGMAMALLCTAGTLRGLRRESARGLLGGTREEVGAGPARRRTRRLAVAAVLASALLVAGAVLQWISETAGFFGAGTLLLASSLALQWNALSAGGRTSAGGELPGLGWLARVPRSRERPLAGRVFLDLVTLGVRNATHRPGRSLLCIALIASATFVIVAVGAFRRDPGALSFDRRSGSGGFALLAQSVLPLHHDPGTAEGREALNLAGPEAAALQGVAFARFRVRAGDDASCLNLYRARSPTVLGASPAFLREGRFAFQRSLAQTPEERANPWLLLERESADGAIPVIADAASMTYVLHKKLGDEIALDGWGPKPVRLRIVAALRDSLFQGELLMGEAAFLKAFAAERGYRFFLLDAPLARLGDVASLLESRLGDFGFDVMPAAERLEGFHRVENTYLSTFQTLGGLGLLLGTLGLASVVVRNALERRRELALLSAVGYRREHVSRLVLAENALLLLLGLGTGAVCALLAITPALASRGGGFPATAVAGLILAVFVTGVLASRLAVRAIHRSPLLAALRSE